MILLPLLAVHSASTVWVVYLLGFCGSTVAFFAGPFGSAAIPQLVERDKLSTANSGFIIGGNLGRIGGPSIAGVLLGAVGLDGVVIADTLTFIVSGLLVSFLLFPTLQTDAGRADSGGAASARMVQPGWQAWQEGIRVAAGDRQLAILFLGTMISCIGGGMFDPLLAPFVHHVLAAPAQVYGTLVSVRGAGGLLGGLALGTIVSRIEPRILVGWGGILVGGLCLVLVVLATVPSTFIGIGLAAVAGSASFIGQQTIFQSSVSDAFRGRIFGAYLSMIALCFLAGTAAGSLCAGLVGIQATMAGGSVIQGIAAAVLLRGLTGPNTRMAREEQHTPGVL